MMEVTLTIDGVAKTVSIDRNGDRYRIAIEGRKYDVADVSSAEGTLAFLVDRESYIAHVSEGDGGTLISIRGRNYRLVEEEMDVDRPGASAAHGDGRLEAPMPGNIVAVYAAEGDSVTAGQPIVVLESMKMQNEITSPIDGVVARILCKAGDQVGFGDVVAEIAAPASERNEE